MIEKGAIKKSTAQAICDAVKVKEGTTEGVPFKDVAKRILAIPKEKPEQEKTVDIAENGTVEILPDEGYMLSKVTANVNVSASGESKFMQLVDGTITEITAADLEGATKIRAQAFLSCTNLKKVVMPNTITDVGSSPFSGCSSLNTIIFSNNLTTLPDRVVQNLKALTNVIIPEGVQVIPYSGFSGCTNLTNLTLPSSITQIGTSGLKIGSETNKATIRFLGTTPPSIQIDSIGGNVEKIKVPVGCGDIYKSATNFSAKADIIEEDAE